MVVDHIMGILATPLMKYSTNFGGPKSVPFVGLRSSKGSSQVLLSLICYCSSIFGRVVSELVASS
jgi:hypothetical protein